MRLALRGFEKPFCWEYNNNLQKLSLASNQMSKNQGPGCLWRQERGFNYSIWIGIVMGFDQWLVYLRQATTIQFEIFFNC